MMAILSPLKDVREIKRKDRQEVSVLLTSILASLTCVFSLRLSPSHQASMERSKETTRREKKQVYKHVYTI